MPTTSTTASQPPRPNVLWLTCEDMGPHLGCYGDNYATAPHLNRLAVRGLRYLNVWANAPVCAPARTALISGMYPTATGSEHMRSMTRLPAGMKMYPQFLREAGYYCFDHFSLGVIKPRVNYRKTATNTQIWALDASVTHVWQYGLRTRFQIQK